MSLTQEQIAHIARLSRLSLSPEELEKYRTNLSSVVDYVDTLASVPEESLVGISPSFPFVLPLREDVVKEKKDPTRKELLSCSPQRVVADQIAIPNIMG
jgi:aspartyl-tRNA(Asn)/glutamyl-tRNA(Gln) amidotransferase subunit C